MIDDSSRYARVGTAELSVTSADGSQRSVSYLKRRLLPPLSALEAVGEHLLGEDERLDSLTARYYNDPTMFHRLCDGNVQSDPTVLLGQQGDKMRLTQPKT